MFVGHLNVIVHRLSFDVMCVFSSTSLLPVLEEEEEGVHESVQVPAVNVDMAGRRKPCSVYSTRY